MRSYEWYLMDPSQRRELLAEHGKMAREYLDVRANTVACFSLNDYEWLLAFEADELHRIVDLMRHLRGRGRGCIPGSRSPSGPAGVSRSTSWSTPFPNGRRAGRRPRNAAPGCSLLPPCGRWLPAAAAASALRRARCDGHQL